jgi:hypothetical protein
MIFRTVGLAIALEVFRMGLLSGVADVIIQQIKWEDSFWSSGFPAGEKTHVAIRDVRTDVSICGPIDRHEAAPCDAEIHPVGKKSGVEPWTTASRKVSHDGDQGEPLRVSIMV